MIKAAVVVLAIGITLVASNDTRAAGCSWFSPCKPIVHLKKTKASPAIVRLEKRLTADEVELKTYQKVNAMIIAGIYRKMAEMKK